MLFKNKNYMNLIFIEKKGRDVWVYFFFSFFRAEYARLIGGLGLGFLHIEIIIRVIERF